MKARPSSVRRPASANSAGRTGPLGWMLVRLSCLTGNKLFFKKRFFLETEAVQKSPLFLEFMEMNSKVFTFVIVSSKDSNK